MNFFWLGIQYVMADSHFWPAMAFTTIIGLLIGSVLYDGVVEDVKKGMIAILSYSGLLFITNLSRILPIVSSCKVVNPSQPFAGLATLVLVTIFYALGMLMGVIVTNRAHNGRE